MTLSARSASSTVTKPAPAVASAIGRPARSSAARPRRLAAAPPHTADAWTRHLSRLLSTEIGTAVANETITPAEAEQLLARLVLVIDQAITTKQP